MASPSPVRRENSWSGMGAGFSIATTILAGMLLWGGLGYLLDRLVWDEMIFTALGFILGAFGGGYIVYLRHGKGEA